MKTLPHGENRHTNPTGDAQRQLQDVLFNLDQLIRQQRRPSRRLHPEATAALLAAMRYKLEGVQHALLLSARA